MIPQATIQATALAATPIIERSGIQYVSVVWSILNIAFTFASTTVQFDKNETLRALAPAHFFGCIEESSENTTSLTLGLFGLGYVFSKISTTTSFVYNTAHLHSRRRLDISRPGAFRGKKAELAHQKSER